MIAASAVGFLGNGSGKRVRHWHWIEAAVMPRVTMSESSGREDTAFQYAVPGNCLRRIVGTSRKKPATLTEIWADTQFVGAQQDEQQRFDH